MTKRRPPSLEHPLLADMVARGVLTLPTSHAEGPPPRLPVANADEILASLDDSRADR